MSGAFEATSRIAYSYKKEKTFVLSITLQSPFLLFGMAAMPIPLWCSYEFDKDSLA